MKTFRSFFALALLFALVGCKNETRTTADQYGVGAICVQAADCLQPDPPCDGGAGCFNQQCLTQFSGGYCGIQGCTANADCPVGSACVAHTDGQNYCFRTCGSKDECNVNRDAANEANCSSSVTFVEASTNTKACVPSSSGI